MQRYGGYCIGFSCYTADPTSNGEKIKALKKNQKSMK